MSGHSKWAQIKHKKALTDAKKGKIFSKIARMLTIAARQKGPDPESNPQLRLAIEKAKEVNTPSDNIERAIRRGAGSSEEAALEEFLYEAYGPAGSALIILGITDNKNRSSNEIKHLLSENGGKIANPGSVLWLFKQKAVFELAIAEIPLKIEELELALIDSGAEEIRQKNGFLEIIAPMDKNEAIKKALKTKSLAPISSAVEWVSENKLPLGAEDKEKLEKLAEALLEHDDVQEVFSNDA